MASSGAPAAPAPAQKRRAIAAPVVHTTFGEVDMDTSDESLVRVHPQLRPAFAPDTTGTMPAGMTGVGPGLPGLFMSSAPPAPTSGGHGGVPTIHNPSSTVHNTVQQSLHLNHDPSVTARAEQLGYHYGVQEASNAFQQQQINSSAHLASVSLEAQHIINQQRLELEQL